MANKVDFSKFDKAIDVEGLKKDIADAESNTGNFKDVPFDSYIVKVDKLELVASSKGDPMVSGWFKIVEGEYKGQRIFMNQVVTQGFQLHIMDTFLKDLDSGVEVKFENFTQYGNMLLDIHEKIAKTLEYQLRYYDNKGYSAFEIEDVFDVE